MSAEPTWSAPVRYAESDQQGVVFNAHYLTWCDEAMSAFFIGRGVDYAGLENSGQHTQLVHSELTWSAAARWGQTVNVHVRPERIGRTSFVLSFDVRADDQPACLVRTTYVITDPAGTPIPVPQEIRQHFAR
ncbi:MAG: acyl-CoA thioesterase [Haloechinothrix sp.]